MKSFPGLTTALATAALCLNLSGMVTTAQDCVTYIGTYTGPNSKGIYRARFNLSTGQLSKPELAIEAKSPSWLALHPRKPFLYAVSEISNFEGRPTGAVSAFKFEKASGELTLVNQQASQGKGPTHLSLDSKGKCVMVANYGSGSVAALPILKDGSLGPAASTIQHVGSSVNPKRQEGPHAHQIVPSPDDHFALVCDLGLDQVRQYRLNPAKAVITPEITPFTKIAPGSGPRHLVFRPDGKFVFVLNELGSTLMSFEYDKKTGGLALVNTASTLPKGFSGESWAGAIDIHPNGKFVYASNRGHDSIAVFEIDRQTGAVSLVENVPSGGKYPRFFVMHPSGRWFISMNQNSGDILVFAVDSRTGKLTETGSRQSVGSPTCAVFVQ